MNRTKQTTFDPKQEKAKRVNHHQTRITRYATGTSLKRRGGEKIKNMNNKIAITTYLSKLL